MITPLRSIALLCTGIPIFVQAQVDPTWQDEVGNLVEAAYACVPELSNSSGIMSGSRIPAPIVGGFPAQLTVSMHPHEVKRGAQIGYELRTPLPLPKKIECESILVRTSTYLVLPNQRQLVQLHPELEVDSALGLIERFRMSIQDDPQLAPEVRDGVALVIVSVSVSERSTEVFGHMAFTMITGRAAVSSGATPDFELSVIRASN